MSRIAAVATALPEHAYPQADITDVIAPLVTRDPKRQALLRRPADGFATTAAFWGSSSLAGLSSGEGAAPTAVTTTWFALRVDVRRGDTTVEQHGLIDATHLPARVAARHWGEPS